MKTRSLRLAFLVVLVTIVGTAKVGFSQQKKSDTIAIKTSAVCGMCKDRIEGTLAYEKGVKSSSLDPETSAVTIVYNPSKTSPEKLRGVLSKLGYDADALPADEKAYAKLPACCKKDAPKH